MKHAACYMTMLLMLVASCWTQANQPKQKKEDQFLEELSLGRQDIYSTHTYLGSNRAYFGQMDTVFRGIHTIHVHYYGHKALKKQVPTTYMGITLDTACRILQKSSIRDKVYTMTNIQYNTRGAMVAYRELGPKTDMLTQWINAEQPGDTTVCIRTVNGQISSKEYSISDSAMHLSWTMDRRKGALVLTEKDSSIWGREKGVWEYKSWILNKYGYWRLRYHMYHKHHADSTTEKRDYTYNYKTGALSNILYELYNQRDDLYKQYWVDRKGKQHLLLLVDFDYEAGTYTRKSYDHKGREYVVAGTITNACTPRKQNETRQYADKDGRYNGERSRTYDETADCKTRIIERKNRKGEVTSRTVTTLDSQDRPTLSQTYDAKHVLKAKTTYTYTDHQR